LLRDYYYLTKPGIIRGNAVSATAGFLLAAKGHIKFGLFVATLGGLSLVIASACVFNNYIDRAIDEKMARTKRRALVSGAISGRNALIYASILGVSGVVILSIYTNWLATLIALFGFIMYVVVYGIWKRRSTLGTVVGSLSGATPPVIGYCAVTGRFDWAALVLFLILVFWQMPHFFAIAMYRLKDYAAASLPVLPVKKGIQTTKIQMLAYTLGFVIASVMLSVLGYTGWVYLGVALIIGISWTALCVRGFWVADDSRWARQMFFCSLIALSLLCVTISVDHFLP
jgi:heme o synthase